MTNGEWPGRVGVEMLISAGPAGGPGTGRADEHPHCDLCDRCNTCCRFAARGRVGAAAAPSNGCPSGYQLVSVPTLAAEGYRVPALVDSPRSGVVGEGPGVRRGWIGQPGNGDGWVCAVQLGNQLTPFGLPVYNFIDNQLPA
jgi:hypothetical protein